VGHHRPLCLPCSKEILQAIQRQLQPLLSDYVAWHHRLLQSTLIFHIQVKVRDQQIHGAFVLETCARASQTLAINKRPHCLHPEHTHV